MKVRIGIGLGAGGASDHDTFTNAVERMEQLGFDSLWLSEVLTTGVIDPLAGLAFVPLVGLAVFPLLQGWPKRCNSSMSNAAFFPRSPTKAPK